MYYALLALRVNGLIKQDLHAACRSHTAKHLEAKAVSITFHGTLLSLLAASGDHGKVKGVGSEERTASSINSMQHRQSSEDMIICFKGSLKLK